MAKLTFETDDLRIANKVTSIVDTNGRRIAFYEKEFTSGRTSGGIVVQGSGLLAVDIEVGSGALNGSTPSWTQGNELPVIPNTIQLACYNLDNSQLEVITDFSMDNLNNVIYLAWIFAGSTTIVRILNIEPYGKYIYARRQIDTGGGNYEYQGTEQLMNAGEAPSAIYDKSTDRIYMTYRKNSVVYQRIIEVGNESGAWDYLIDFLDTGGVIVFTDSFKNQTFASSGSVSGYSVKFTNVMNQRVPHGNDTNNFSIAFPVHFMHASQGIIPEFYEIYTKPGGVFSLQESISYGVTISHDMTAYEGLYVYIGLRGKMFNSNLPYDFVIEPSERIRIFVKSGDITIEISSTYIQSTYRQFGSSSISSVDGVNLITLTDTELTTKILDPETDAATSEVSSVDGVNLITLTDIEVETIILDPLSEPLPQPSGAASVDGLGVIL